MTTLMLIIWFAVCTGILALAADSVVKAWK